jgi:hypothetical protein
MIPQLRLQYRRNVNPSHINSYEHNSKQVFFYKINWLQNVGILKRVLKKARHVDTLVIIEKA